MRERATLDHFDRLFTGAADPWGTRTSRDEAHKRRVVLRMLGTQTHGRVLELGCGNGSNSQVLASRALSLDACDGSKAALRRADQTVGGLSRVKLHHLPLPSRFPRSTYDAIVIAEMLYYLDDRTLAFVMREIERSLRPGGSLVLCHHHRQFADAAQKQPGFHARFTRRSRINWQSGTRHRTSRWEAQTFWRPRNRIGDTR
ncbi:class I SAM-dependent methyltransferase [Rhodophyticola sp.]|uniref:class I SAM-dependent methyltransferase n=1 Tax=Rhodophyticola sp. TaxID=2680032 RepID=UPI003D26E082